MRNGNDMNMICVCVYEFDSNTYLQQGGTHRHPQGEQQEARQEYQQDQQGASQAGGATRRRG